MREGMGEGVELVFISIHIIQIKTAIRIALGTMAS